MSDKESVTPRVEIPEEQRTPLVDELLQDVESGETARRGQVFRAARLRAEMLQTIEGSSRYLSPEIARHIEAIKELQEHIPNNILESNGTDPTVTEWIDTLDPLTGIEQTRPENMFGEQEEGRDPESIDRLPLLVFTEECLETAEHARAIIKQEKEIIAASVLMSKFNLPVRKMDAEVADFITALEAQADELENRALVQRAVHRTVDRWKALQRQAVEILEEQQQEDDRPDHELNTEKQWQRFQARLQEEAPERHAKETLADNAKRVELRQRVEGRRVLGIGMISEALEGNTEADPKLIDGARRYISAALEQRFVANKTETNPNKAITIPESQSRAQFQQLLEDRTGKPEDAPPAIFATLLRDNLVQTGTLPEQEANALAYAVLTAAYMNKFVQDRWAGLEESDYSPDQNLASVAPQWVQAVEQLKSTGVGTENGIIQLDTRNPNRFRRASDVLWQTQRIRKIVPTLIGGVELPETSADGINLSDKVSAAEAATPQLASGIDILHFKPAETF